MLNRKSFEAALPDMPTGVIVPVIAPYVCRQQPLHPSTQIPVMPRPNGQMEVIRHQAIGQHSHRDPSAGFLEQRTESLIIPRLVEHFPPCIPTIDDMVTDPAYRSSRCPWHGLHTSRFGSDRQEKVECPLLRISPCKLPRQADRFNIEFSGLLGL